jgi:L-rhamnose mutarotase
MSRRFCFALDLKDDPALIAEYRKYHETIWPEVTQSLKDSGIEDLEIYLAGTRMFMIMEVTRAKRKATNRRLSEMTEPCIKLSLSAQREKAKFSELEVSTILFIKRGRGNPTFAIKLIRLLLASRMSLLVTV